MPTPPSFLLVFIAEQTSNGMEHPFGHFWSADQAMSPSKILPTPKFDLLDWGGWGVGMLKRQQ